MVSSTFSQDREKNIHYTPTVLDEYGWYEVTHKIKNFENLRSVAKEYGVTTVQLAKWNNLLDNYNISLVHLPIGYVMVVYVRGSIDDKKEKWNKKILTELKQKHPLIFLPKDEFETTSEYDIRKEKQKQLIIKYENEALDILIALNDENERIFKEQYEEKVRALKQKIAESIKEVYGYISDIGNYNADNETFSFITVRFVETTENAIGYVEEGSGMFNHNEFTSISTDPIWDNPPNHRYAKVVTYLTYDEKFSRTSDKSYKEVIAGWHKGKYYPIYYQQKSYLDPKNYIDVKIARKEARSFKKNYKDVEIIGTTQLDEDLANYHYFNLYAIHPITGKQFKFGLQKNISGIATVSTKKSLIPSDLSMKVAFIDKNDNGYLDAEEEGKIKVSVSNSGKGTAYGVNINLSDDGNNQALVYDKYKIMGEIAPDQKKETAFKIRATRGVPRLINEFTITAEESYGFQPDPVLIRFETYPFIPPQLELVDFGIKTADGNNIIKSGIETTIQTRIQNTGQGPAENSIFKINLPPGLYFTPDSRKEYSFSSLKPGEFKDLEFSFNTSKNIDKSSDVTISYVEDYKSGSFILPIEIEKPLKTIQEFVVSGKELSNTIIQNVATISVDIEKDIPKSKIKKKYDLAVVFGIENYKNVSSVSFAKRDAQWMKVYFENILGIPSNRIYYKTDSDVSLAEFNLAFGRLVKKTIKKEI